MRISDNLKKILLKIFKECFGEVDVILFGSRINDSKKGGDYDFAIKGISKEKFKQKKIKCLKNLLENNLDDLPIDIVHFESADEFFKNEINKGVKL